MGRGRFLWLALGLVAVSCGAPLDGSDGDVQVSEVVKGTELADFLDPAASLERFLLTVHRAGALAWASVESIEDTVEKYVVSFSVDDILWQAEGVSVSVGEVFPSREFTARQFLTAKSADVRVGDRVLTGIVDGVVRSIAKQGGDGGFFQPDSRLTYHVLAFGERSDFVTRVLAAPSLPCRSVEQRVSSSGYVDTLLSYLEGTTARQEQRQQQNVLNEIDRTADELVQKTPEHVDSVLGETVPHNDYDVIQQLLDGVDPDDVVVRPTVPVFWDVAELVDRTNLVVATADLGELLGLVELTADMSSGFDANPTVAQSFLGAPPTGADVGIWQVAAEDLIGCQIPADYLRQAASSGILITEIPYDSFAGQRRSLITLSSSEAILDALTSEDIGSLDDSAS